MKLEPGQVISGTLRLLRRIADGGMGSVWIAEHLVLGREVAIKLMSKQWAAMPSARTRFLREARMTAQIDSPHVVRVLDCRLDEADEPYLVLELLHGETLEERVRRHGPLSVYEVEEIVSQTCEALAAAHDARIVHRDVKPENIFLVAGGPLFVKVLDFGVAKPRRTEDCLDVDRLPAGTPQYMSPEHMFEPETTDERSDLFSLAAVAYFALTRRSPFEAESLEALYFAIEGASFKRPSALRPELPQALDAWFEKALAREREARFGSAREMAAALRAALRASSSSAEVAALPDNDPAAATATAADANDDVPATELPTLSRIVPGLRTRRRAGRAFAFGMAAVAAATALVWRSEGDLRTAIASPPLDPAESHVEGPGSLSSGPAALPAAVAPATSPARAKKVARSVPARPAPAAAPSPRPATAGPGAAPAEPSDAEARPDSYAATSTIQEIIGSVPNPDVAP